MCLGRRLALISAKKLRTATLHFLVSPVHIGPEFQRYLMQHLFQGLLGSNLPLTHSLTTWYSSAHSFEEQPFEVRVAPLGTKSLNAKQSGTPCHLRNTVAFEAF